MTQRVTVAVDGGPASTAALDWVISRALTTPLALQITSVARSGTDLPGDPVDDTHARSQEVLDAALERVHTAVAHLDVTTKLREGDALGALIGASEHCDLLVIGAHRPRPLASVTRNTLALQLAANSRCAVVVVPSDWTPGAGPVVVGWTGDDTADVALSTAAAEAELIGHPLTIVHAPSVELGVASDVSASALAREEFTAADRAALAGVAATVRAAHPALTVKENLAPRAAAVAIVRAASNAALVVVGSRGRGRIAGFFLGSTSQDVLLNLPAPVMVVPRKHSPIDVYPELVDEDLL